MTSITDKELKSILEQIIPFEIDREGDQEKKYTFDHPIGHLIYLNSQITIKTFVSPSKPVEDEGYLRYEPQPDDYMIDFDMTQLWIDCEDVLSDEQIDIFEKHLKDIISVV